VNLILQGKSRPDEKLGLLFYSKIEKCQFLAKWWKDDSCLIYQIAGLLILVYWLHQIFDRYF